MSLKEDHKTDEKEANATKEDVKERGVMILDTETSGLPTMAGYNKFYHPSDVQMYRKARIIQLAFELRTKKALLIGKYCKLRKSDDFKVDATHIHGITQKVVDAQGISMEEIADELELNLDKVDTVIGHNILFDINVIRSELYRIKREALADKLMSKVRCCTMEMGEKRYGRKLKLVHLYEILSGEKLNGAHRADVDVAATTYCYFKLL